MSNFKGCFVAKLAMLNFIILLKFWIILDASVPLGRHNFTQFSGVRG